MEVIIVTDRNTPDYREGVLAVSVYKSGHLSSTKYRSPKCATKPPFLFNSSRRPGIEIQEVMIQPFVLLYKFTLSYVERVTHSDFCFPLFVIPGLTRNPVSLSLKDQKIALLEQWGR